MSTIGIDFKIKTTQVNNENIKLQIWDTAGQERFRTISSAYYRGAHGIIIVFDITNIDTFNNVKKWLNEISIHAYDDVKKIIVGTKCDLTNERKVTIEQIKELTDEIQIKYIEVSAKESIRISDIFTYLIKEIMNTEQFNLSKKKVIVQQITKPETNCEC